MNPPLGPCSTCPRSLAARACAGAEHRRARGEPAPTEQVAPGMRECPKCHQVKPLAKFVDRGGLHERAIRRATCGTCRFESRVRRNVSKRGRRTKERADTEQFWKTQAATH